MMRGLSSVILSICIVVSVGCVSVEKPLAVAECEKTGKCSDNSGSGGVGDAQPMADVQEKLDLLVGPGFDTGQVAADGLNSDGPNSDRAVGLLPDVGSVQTPDLASDRISGVLPDTASGDAVDDVPVPSGACWTDGAPVPAGTVCRPASGLCDLAEVCDGVSPNCPVDKYAAAATVCRPAAGDCDIAESCTGSSPDCPANTLLSAGAICRAVAGPCDVAESCSGTTAECPDDGMAPAGTVCRVSTDGNVCDPAEACAGTETTCPADTIYPRPAPPTNVTGIPGVLQATISWTAAAGATGYNVKRSTVSGSHYTIQGTPPTAAASPYISTGLTGGTPYYFIVSSINTIASCESLSDSVEVQIIPGGICTPPAIPTVTAAASDGQVTLSWSASVGATSYGVARSVTTGTGYASVGAALTGTTYKDINVSNGTTYYYVVSASNGTCSSGTSIEVTAAPTCTPTAAPTLVTATANNGSVALSWTAPTGAVSYRVLRSTTSGAGYALVGTSGTASYTDTTVSNGTTYYYVVVASNGACNSVNSTEAAATPACTPPSTPINLTAVPGNGQIVLSWTASTGGATLYQVFRSATAGGPYTTPLASPVSAGYTDATVVNGTTYYYVVSASNGACASINSAEVFAAPVCVPPSVPTGLAGTPGDGKVTLSWTASTGGPASYTVSRGTTTGGPYTTVGTPTSTTFTDSAVVNGTAYFYVVSSSNGSCGSDATAQVAVTPSAGCAQAAPTGVTATAGSQKVTLTWVASAGATSYSIGRSATSGSGYTSAGSVTAPTVTFADTDTTLVNGTKYYYVVTAVNATCSSPSSTEVSATPACTVLAAPAGVTATADNSNGHITVAWTAAPDATAYTVSRGTASGGPFTAVSTNQPALNYPDSTGLAGGTVYYYVVSATSAGGNCSSPNSTPAVSARSCTVPGIPGGVSATAGISRVTVSWTAVTGADSYNVFRSTSSTGPFTTSVGTPAASPFVDSNASNGTTYYYQVAARNGGGNCSSANSGTKSAVPRGCTVASGNSGNFNTVDRKCFVTCDTITGWNCSNTDGRTITINGGPLACGAMPIPAPKRSGYNVIDVSAGTLAFASLAWWGTANATCSIPSGGLDF
jgi:fibronectin type 3 domain-containing protein